MKQQKIGLMGKDTRTINFDSVVLQKLDERAKLTGSSVSNIVNFIVRQHIMNDAEYYRELAKYHLCKFNEYNYMKETSMIQIEMK